MIHKIILATLFSAAAICGQAQVSMQTFTYAVKDRDTLKLDWYSEAGDTATKSPCMLFVFGGAFVGGKRDDSNYLHYFHQLAEDGIRVASVSYRLGLKGVSNLSVFNTAPLQKAIGMAVEDVSDATKWILIHRDSLKVDNQKIMLSGSSSGAITVLETEFRTINGINSILSSSFRYAGVIGFSGAIFSTHGRPVYKSTPSPALFFHGTADHIVPYKSLRLFNKGLFGSSTLARIYKKHHYPYYFYKAEGLGHEVSVGAIIQEVPLILDFVHRYVIAGEQLQIETLVKDPAQKPMLTISSKALFKKLANNR